MQTCFFAFSRCDGSPIKRSPQIKAAAHQGLRQARPHHRGPQLRRHRQRLGQPGAGRNPRPSPSRQGPIGTPVPQWAPDFVRRVTSVIMAGKGDLLPVSALPADGRFPSATSRFEKMGIAAESRCGTRTSASTAASAPSCALTPRSA